VLELGTIWPIRKTEFIKGIVEQEFIGDSKLEVGNWRSDFQFATSNSESPMDSTVDIPVHRV
jgi:hypothetical protein